MYCGKCGSTIPDGDVFCSECGAPISGNSEKSSEQVILQPAPITRTNGVAIAGLIIGIVSLCLCWLPIVGMIIGIVGLVLSIIGLRLKKSYGSGGGMAAIGMIFSLIGILALPLVLGISSYTNNPKGSDTTQTSSIQTKTQRIYNMVYEIPGSWLSKESGDQYYYDITYFPDANNTTLTLYVDSTDFSKDNVTKEAFERVADGTAELAFYNAGLKQTTIDKKVEEKGNYYVERASIYATGNGAKREALVYAAYDKETRRCYRFLFILPENENECEEYRKTINTIFESMKLL